MSNAITSTATPLDLLQKQASSLVSGLKDLVKEEETPEASPFEKFSRTPQDFETHTAKTGEVKPGLEELDKLAEPSLTKYQATKHLGRIDGFIPASIGVHGSERQIHSGDLVISTSQPGTDEIVSTRISILNEVDAQVLDPAVRDAADGPVTSLEKLAAKIDELPGISAQLNKGRLSVTSDNPTTKFTIEDHGTGLLQQMGGENVEVREAFDRFVGTTFYGQMLSAMRKTVQEPAYFHGGRAEEMFRNQLDAVLAEELTKAGNGEFSEALYQAQFNAVA